MGPVHLGIHNQTHAFFALKAKMAAIYLNDGHYGEDNPEKEQNYLTRFYEQQTQLADLFGDDLKLTEYADSPTSKQIKMLFWKYLALGRLEPLEEPLK